MPDAGRPLILVRRKQAGDYTQGDVTGKVDPGPAATAPAERFSQEEFPRNDRELWRTRGTFSVTSPPPQYYADEAFGWVQHPDPEVAAAFAQIEAELRSGKIGSSPILVRGKPLADRLSLDEVARWLRTARGSS